MKASASSSILNQQNACPTPPHATSPKERLKVTYYVASWYYILPLCNRQTHRIIAVSLCKYGGTTSRSGFPAQSSSSKVITAPSACGRVFSRLFCSRRIRSAFRWASDSGISWILFSERINSCAYTISKRAALHSQESGAA